MRYSQIFSVSFLLFAATSDQPAKKYKININGPGETRWSEVCDDYKEEIIHLIDGLKGNRTVLIKELEKVVDQFDKHIPEPYASEMKGLAACTGLDYADVVLMNLLYDLTAGCTSLIVEDGAGHIWHGRNLDYSMGAALRALVIQADWVSHNKTQWRSVHYAGYVGVLTGVVPGKFSVSLDERDEGSRMTNVEDLLKGYTPVTWAIRNTISKAVVSPDMGFQEAVEDLAKDKVVAPAYIILGGVNAGEGAVLTRWQDKADVWYMKSADYKGEGDKKWFILETNYDHWLPAPSHDDRRDAAVAAIEQVGQQNINRDTLYAAMSSKKVYNMDTTYTSIMSAATGYLNTTIRAGQL